ncbi:MAG TPA: biotin carboxylase N-terminal domain-containing protein [candidate division Zixibacteria bacterium]|nr:biotin carboxylase N-terminal domain-containing protein [candidate division Zixibacteria bacterium]
MGDEHLTPRQVADRLGVTVRTVQRWVAQGRLPARRVGGRVRIPRDGLAGLAPAQATDHGPWPARPIHTLLIANRGEIAARVGRTARALGIRSIALQAPDDVPPRDVDEVRRVPGYLDGDAILAAARAAGADAVHPGYGFLAENPSFAEAVEAAGLVWVGPPPGAIAAMGDKAAARRLAAAHDVPVLPGYDGEDQSDQRLLAEAARIGFPLLVKPAGGGGGKGMRTVRRAEDLPEALAAARREARGAFGDERLVLERLLDGPRHVEVQVLFDRHRRGVHLGERDCSAQRRRQKVVEEAPGPVVTADLRRRMGEAALRVAAAAGYVGAGTVEFLLADDGTFHFLEMNTRLQVEHPVTEAVTGRDLVADQLRIAAGEPLDLVQDDVRWRGHAIEARLYAEDPESGFLPAVGRIVHLRWPDGVRVDAGIREGDTVTDRYDPMLAKLIARGSTRRDALLRLRTALEATEVLGVRTNLRFLRWLLAHPAMRQGDVRTDTVESLMLPDPPQPNEAAWRAAALALRGAGVLPAGVWGGGWRPNLPPVIRVRHGDQVRRVELSQGVGERAQSVRMIGTISAQPEGGWSAYGPVAVDVERGTAFVSVEGQSLEFDLAPPPSVEEAVRHAAAQDGGSAVLTAPMPGRVIAVRVQEGASVDEHETVIVIEAMKMEHAVAAPLHGTVRRIAVREGQQVQRGDVLAEVSGRP